MDFDLSTPPFAELIGSPPTEVMEPQIPRNIWVLRSILYPTKMFIVDVNHMILGAIQTTAMLACFFSEESAKIEALKYGMYEMEPARFSLFDAQQIAIDNDLKYLALTIAPGQYHLIRVASESN